MTDTFLTEEVLSAVMDGTRLAATCRRRSVSWSINDALLTVGAVVDGAILAATRRRRSAILSSTDAEVGLMAVGLLIDMLDIRAEMSSTVWTWAGRLAVAGTTEPLTWTD